MKVTQSQLKQIIKEELREYGNYSAAAGAALRSAQLTSGASIDGGSPPAELTLGDLVAELRALLQAWEEKDYSSDEARYQGYYEDIVEVTSRYDPCAHPGSCADAHPDQSHEECIEDNEESDVE